MMEKIQDSENGNSNATQECLETQEEQSSSEASQKQQEQTSTDSAEGVALEAHGETEVSPVRSSTAQSHRDFDALKSLGETTSRIVQQAASILEEEVAAGIIAAKQVEQRFVNVEKVRSSNPEEVMQRFRRDAHEVVDILLDVISVGTKSISGLTQRVMTIRGGERQTQSEPMMTGNVPTLTVPHSIKAGESAEVPMSVANDSDSQTDEFGFNCSDLINAAGDTILAQQITFTPPSLAIGPHHTEKVMVTINVPKETPSGVYSGLIQATKLDQLRAVLMVQID